MTSAPWHLHTDERGHMLLTRDGIPEERLCLRMCAGSYAEELVVARILAILNASEGTVSARLFEVEGRLRQVAG